MSESRSRRETETESSIEVVQIDGLVSVILIDNWLLVFERQKCILKSTFSTLGGYEVDKTLP